MIPILSNIGRVLNALGWLRDLFCEPEEHESGCYSKPWPEGRSGACSCRLAGYPRAKS